MNQNEIRALQAPLKRQYRDDPASALVTLRAEGQLGGDVTCNVATARATVRAGLHPATGGNGLHTCSGDMLLQALVACAGVTLAAVAASLGVTVRSGEIAAEGDLDFRGTLGVAKDAPVGFRQIRLFIQVDTDATPEARERLLDLTHRYCVVYQTLRNGAELVPGIGTAAPR